MNTKHCVAITIVITDMALNIEIPYEMCSTALQVSHKIDALYDY